VAMFLVRVNSGGGTLETGQYAFGVQDYLTYLLWIAQGGNGGVSGPWSAANFTTTAVDGRFSLNAANTNNAATSDLTGGEYWFNKTLNAPTYRNADNTANITGVTDNNAASFTNKTFDANATGNSLKVGYGSAPTVSASGQIGIDNTSDQLVYYGSSVQVIDPTREVHHMNFGPSTDNVVLIYTDRPITVYKVAVVQEHSGTPSTTFNIYHDTTRAGVTNKVFTNNQTATSKTTGDVYTSGFSDVTIPANSWVYYKIATLANADTFYIQMFYTVDRQ
jgi:hypothetical protein